MGGGPSQPAQISDEENERIHAEFQANLEREERQRAEAERQRAEEDRLLQEFQAKLKRAEEEEQRKLAAEEAARIKANTPFQKPTPPTLALTNKLSNQCQRCDIVIPPGLSSSSVILSRNILSNQPLIIIPPKPIEPGWYRGTRWEKRYVLNFMVPENLNDMRINEATGISYFKDVPTKYACAFPNKKFPEVWVDGRPSIDLFYVENEENPATKIYNEQEIELAKNKQKIENPELRTVLWNPSETKGENGAVAINYKTHGALTKVFLKPTIPFSITYGTAIDVDKAARKAEEAKKKQREEAKKKAEEDKKKAEEDSKKAKK
jgi:hypothetical protein